MSKLNEYNEKRNFVKTKEPAGQIKVKKEKRLKFVIQHHIASKDHYDFRLELNGVYLSWAIPKGPSYNPKDKRLAIKVEDHPLDYGKFEGTIPKGEYGGGTIMVWDNGEWIANGNAAESLKKGYIKFALGGKRFKGNWILTRFKSNAENEKNWLLIKEDDEHAKDEPGISEFITSIKTNRTMDEITNAVTLKKTKNETQDDIKKLLKIKGEVYKVKNIEISHPDKIVFASPKVKKIDVVLYYAYVAKYMLPYIKGRLLSVRCPKGIGSACFFKKHPNETNENIETVQISETNKEKEEYFCINTERGLISEAQMGTLEFHTWASHTKALEKPDMLVFDLDPGEDVSLQKLRQGVRDLKSILDELSLVSFLKTSGGKGYHIVVPLQPSVCWEKFNNFAKNVALVMEQKWPELYTSNMRKDKRKGKIFIDWVRNTRGATTVAPYSLRARKGAPISFPIAWDNLGTVAPNSITLNEAYHKLENENPWQDFFKTRQKLK